MTFIKKLPQLCLLACAALLLLLVGCATPTPLPAPQSRLRLPPQPALVLATEAKPAGYFQQTLLNYFSRNPKWPTTSTTPMPAAELTVSP